MSATFESQNLSASASQYSAEETQGSVNECQVSPWSSWSICFGDCSYGQTVRNRDVLKPALPKRTDKDTPFIGICPHLYETKHCKQNECNKVKDIEGKPIKKSPELKDAIHRERLHKPLNISMKISETTETSLTSFTASFLSDYPSSVDNETSENFSTDSEDNFAAPIKKALPEVDNSPLKAITTLTFIPTTISPQSDSTHGDSRTNTVNFYIKSAVKETIPTNPDYFVNSLTLDIPQHLKPAKERQSKIQDNVSTLQHPSEENDPIMTTESPINDVLKELESTANLNAHLDDKHIKQALKKNKKLMRALVEAYKRRNSGTTLSSTSQKNREDEITTINQTETVESSTRVELNKFINTTSKAESVVPSTTTLIAPISIPTKLSGIPVNQNKTIKLRETAQMRNDDTIAFKIVDGTILAKEPNEKLIIQKTENVTLPPDIRTSEDKITKAAQNAESKNNSTTNASMSFSTAFKDKNNAEVVATTDTAQYWPRKGYVPNTRKHASEITSKLYMTHEIVQALSEEPVRRSPVLRLDCLENRRCCKIVRSECADGSEPKYVKRYYRPRGSSICLAYHYPRCSQGEEMEEQPIHFEQNCQDLCFNGSEKRIAPLLMLSTEN
uniref:BPTI/Kunitz inhibitor domain-containing protein n=1 Tax=Heterorhabditis bacteriophora TaxID=37862 RepID=A0A1I7XLD7_HETBA